MTDTKDKSNDIFIDYKLVEFFKRKYPDSVKNVKDIEELRRLQVAQEILADIYNFYKRNNGEL